MKGELKKLKPPTFDGENRKGEEDEYWFLSMRKYFQLDDYPSNVVTIIVAYNIQGKASMWWDQLK